MGDFWSGETEYDQNEGKRQKERDAAEEAKRQAGVKNLEGYLQNPNQGFDLYGNSDTINQTTANLSQYGWLSGQSASDIGKQNQDYLSSLQNRRNGGDAVAQQMMNQRNMSLANNARGFAGRGVAGGVANAAANTATNQADASINAQTQKNSRQNDQDLFSFVKRQQGQAGDALSMGKDQGLADQLNTDTGSGIFGNKVICTELYAQGILDEETYQLDSLHGLYMWATDPYACIGYQAWALTIVKGMKKSKLFTKAVAFFAVPWANQMAGRVSLRGMALVSFGVPACRAIGWLKVHNPLRNREYYA